MTFEVRYIFLQHDHFYNVIIRFKQKDIKVKDDL